jgi:hypothetical protein
MNKKQKNKFLYRWLLNIFKIASSIGIGSLIGWGIISFLRKCSFGQGLLAIIIILIIFFAYLITIVEKDETN